MVIALNDDEVLFKGHVLPTEEIERMNPSQSSSFVDQIIINAKEIGDKTLSMGADLGRKIEETKIKEQIMSGT